MQISVRSQYGKHTPRILRRQLILQLFEQYLNADLSEQHVSSNECKPSIQRFHGALLFVDISGFTVLAQQLSVEDLQFHINEYFTKMLDIVDKHGGDVIKFAGDALFVVWETSHMMQQVVEEREAGIVEGENETVVDSPSAAAADGEGEEPSESRADPNADFRKGCRMAVTKAVNCGLEINDSCGNHRVSLVARTAATAENEDWYTSAKDNSTSSKSVPEDAHTYLNVHCGVSMGLMAGIDIGCHDRWEFFLMGEPLTKVAMAEAQALTGEIVICPEAHKVMHPSVRPAFQRAMAKLKFCNTMVLNHMNKDTKEAPQQKIKKIADLKRQKSHFDEENAVALPCGCTKGVNGYCRVKKLGFAPAPGVPGAGGGAARANSQKLVHQSSFKRNNKMKTRIDDSLIFEETNGEIESVFDAFLGAKLAELQSVDDIQDEFFVHLSNCVSLNMAPIRNDLLSVTKAALSVQTLGSRVKLEFVKWAHSCLIDDVARHVHDVVRSNYTFEDASRIDVCRRELTSQLATLNATEAVLKAKRIFRASLDRTRSKARHLERTNSILKGTKDFLSRTMSSHKMRTSSWSAKSNGPNEGDRLHEHRGSVIDQDASGFSAEIRSVTVMFVKIDLPHMDLTIEQTNFGSNFGQFGFLSKTVNEGLADVLLVHRLQSCIEALSEAFVAHGGQLRQFIVDDKGTVCIGTFGLRGSVSTDNAAAALETAHMIVAKLKSLNLTCSIGVTLGKAFCGLVGSYSRHEYAVMGPSTNLSARLMCKAPPGGIICDIEIRNHDRAHQFVALAAIVAKGYKNPVGTFTPLFKEAEEASVNRAKLMSKLSLQVSHNLEYSGRPTFKSRSMDEVAEHRQFSTNHLGEVYHWILQKMRREPFYESAADETNDAPLIGRAREIKEILTFLFNSLVEQESPHIAHLRNDEPALFVGVMGAMGLGKTSVVNAVLHQVTKVVLGNRGLKVHVFKSRVNSFQAAVPFNVWKSIVKEMLIRLYNISKMKGAQPKHTGVSVTVSVDLEECVAHVMPLLPEPMRHHTPLLGYLTILPDQPTALAALNMSNEEIVLRSMDLLLGIMQLYVEHTKNLVFLIMEDVHSFDLASQMLLKEVWSAGVGFVVLFSVEKAAQRQARNGSVAAHTSFTSANSAAMSAAIAAAAVNHKDTDLLQNDFAASLHNHERYLPVELELFSKEQTITLVNAALTRSGVVGADNVILNKIFVESGGNPMYAYELAKTVAQMHSEVVDASKLTLKLSNCHRIEEIICHRFDQLSTSAQSLLKIAAAICCYGSNFGFEMLRFVMIDRFHETPRNHDVQIKDDLIDIVTSESFLHASMRGLDGKAGMKVDFADREVAMEGLNEDLYVFEFGISLEKTTIYELLLGDQKQVIHERIAEYFQNQRKKDPTALHHFHEESLHWQRASNWIHAMACSYHASLAAKSEAKAAQHIDMAYRMYRAMRDQQGKEVGGHGGVASPTTAAHSATSWSAVNMKVLFERSLSNQEELHSDHQHARLTLEELSKMFSCDSELLKISLQVEVLVARKFLHHGDKLMDNLHALEEALQIVLLTKNSYLLSSVRVTQMMALLQHHVVDEAVNNAFGAADPAAFFFTVGSDFTPLCLKLLSVYVENYLAMVEESALDALFPKVQFAMHIFHKLAAATEEASQRLQSWSLDLRLHCKAGNFRHASLLGQKIVENYKSDVHSAQLIAYYGMDSVPASLAMIAQYLLLSSEWRTPLRFLHFAESCLEGMKHVASLAGAVYFVCNCLVFLRRSEAALKLFGHYLECVEHLREERSISDGLFCEWLNRLVRAEEYSARGNKAAFENDAAILDDMIHHGSIANALSNSFDPLSVQGRGVEAILAEICALKVILLWDEADKAAELRVFCAALIVYVRRTLTALSGRPHELMFSKTNTVMVILHLLQALTVKPVAPNASESQKVLLRAASWRGQTEDAHWGEKSHLVEELRTAVSDDLINFLWNDCHPQYSVFTLLGISLLFKVKHDLKLVESDRHLSPVSEELPDESAAESGKQLDAQSLSPSAVASTADAPRYDMTRDVKDKLHQVMLNGSCSVKIKVLERYRLLQMATALG